MNKYRHKSIRRAIATSSLKRAMSNKRPKQKKTVIKRKSVSKKVTKSLHKPVLINDKSPMIMPLSLYEKCLKIDDTNLIMYYQLLNITYTKSSIQPKITRISPRTTECNILGIPKIENNKIEI